jgi:hypothetical protein
VAHALKHRDLARRFRIESVVQPIDQHEWWIDLTDASAPSDRRATRIVLPANLHVERTLVELSGAIARIADGTLDEGAPRRCVMCGHTTAFHRDNVADGIGDRRITGTWRCRNTQCDHREPVS